MSESAPTGAICTVEAPHAKTENTKSKIQPGGNATEAKDNVNQPEDQKLDGNATLPEGNTTHPDVNTTHPDGNSTHPKVNTTEGITTQLQGSATQSEGKTQHLEGSASHPDEANNKSTTNQELDEEEEDVPADFFDDFSNKDFLAGLDIVDTWEEGNLKTSKSKDSEKTRIVSKGDNTKQPQKDKITLKSDYRSNRSRVTARDDSRKHYKDEKGSTSKDDKSLAEKCVEELRRDPNKTKRDIQRDKVKCEKDKEAKIISEKLRVVETGLVPPGMEMDVEFNIDPPKEYTFNKSKSSERNNRGSKRVTSRSPSGSRIRRYNRNSSPIRRRVSPDRRRFSPDRRRISPARRRLSSERNRISDDRRRLSPERSRVSDDRRRKSSDRRSPRPYRRSPAARNISPPASPLNRRSSQSFIRASPIFRRSPDVHGCSPVNRRSANLTRSSPSLARSISPFSRASPAFNRSPVFDRTLVRRARRQSRSPVFARDRRLVIDEIKSRRSWKSPSPERKRRKEKSLSHRESSPRKQSFLEEIDAKLSRQNEEDRLRDIRQKLNGMPCVADILNKYAPVATPAPNPDPYPQSIYNPQFFIGANNPTYVPMPVPPPQEYVNTYPQQQPVMNPPYFNQFMNLEKPGGPGLTCQPPFSEINNPYYNNSSAPNNDNKIISIKNKIKVISRCQDAIKCMSEYTKPIGRFCYKKMLDAPEIPTGPPFQSPMKKVPVVRLHYTSERREWMDKEVSPITHLLQKLGLKKPELNFVDDGELELDGMANIPVKMTQTDPMECDVCEARNRIVKVSKSVQCDSAVSVDFSCQVTEDDFLSTARSALKEMLKSQSLSSLTPAQLLAHEGSNAAEEKREVFPAARKLVDESTAKKTPRPGITNNDSYPSRPREDFERRPQPDYSRNFTNKTKSYSGPTMPRPNIPTSYSGSRYEPPKSYNAPQFEPQVSRPNNPPLRFSTNQHQNNFRDNFPQNQFPPNNQDGPNTNFGGPNNMRNPRQPFPYRGFEPTQQNNMGRRF